MLLRLEKNIISLL